MKLTEDLSKEPNLRYPLMLMEKNGQIVGAPAGIPVKVISYTLLNKFLLASRNPEK